MSTSEGGYIMITPLFKLTAIGFLVISSSLISSSVTAEPEPKKSVDIGSEPITNEVIEQGISEAPSKSLPNFPAESDINISRPRNSDLEVYTRSEQWRNQHSGDEDRGTVKLKLPID